MGKDIREKRRALIKEYEGENPYIVGRRKLIFYLLLIMVLSRVVHSVLQTAYLLTCGVALQMHDYLMMFFMIVVAYAFANLIYAYGLKPAVYLALFGGFFSLVMAWRNQVFLYLNTADVFYNIVGILFVAVIVFQICIMLFFCIDKKCGMYFNAMSEIRKEVTEWAKDNFTQKGP